MTQPIHSAKKQARSCSGSSGTLKIIKYLFIVLFQVYCNAINRWQIVSTISTEDIDIGYRV